MNNEKYRQLIENFEYKKLLDRVEQGLILSRTHPTLDLTVYNYDKETQSLGLWDEYTLIARGLVVNSKGQIINTPFPKFFNFGQEHDTVTQYEKKGVPAEVYEKVDGYLIMYFWYQGNPIVMSRGSFDSIFSKKAEELFSSTNYLDWDRDKTYIFELVWPENRIVVEYEEENLYLLGIWDNVNRIEIKYDDFSKYVGNFPKTKRYESQSIKKLHALNITNREGFIKRYEDGYRTKIKFADYVRLHSIVTHISSKTIWKCFKDGLALYDEVDIPDEVDEWVAELVKKLQIQFILNLIKMRAVYETVKHIEDDKEFAFAVQQIRPKVFQSTCFSFRNGHGWRIHNKIWRMIEPEFEAPFLTA